MRRAGTNHATKIKAVFDSDEKIEITNLEVKYGKDLWYGDDVTDEFSISMPEDSILSAGGSTSATLETPDPKNWNTKCKLAIYMKMRYKDMDSTVIEKYDYLKVDLSG